MAKDITAITESQDCSLGAPADLDNSQVISAKASTDPNGAEPIDRDRFSSLAAQGPKSMFVLWDGVYDRVYAAPVRREIFSRVSVVHDLVTPDHYESCDQMWPGVELLFSGWGMPKCDQEFLRRFPDLKMVFYGAGSVKVFATDEFWKRGIRVTTASSANAVPVAEFTLSQILFALKQGWQTVLAGRRSVTAEQFRFSPTGAYGGVVGLISLGLVGRLVLERLRPFDVRVIAYDPFISREEAQRLGVTMVGLEELFAQSDVVSCHAPLLPETRKMLGGSHFAAMKYGTTFINTARGAVVDEEALCDVLRERTDLVAMLDVTDPEPPAPDSELRRLDNIVLTPHIAGSVGQECQRMGFVMLEELDRYLAGKPLLYEVDSARAAAMA
jgi:phosphoglycerate dehydrogenase-like enzyme